MRLMTSRPLGDGLAGQRSLVGGLDQPAIVGAQGTGDSEHPQVGPTTILYQPQKLGLLSRVERPAEIDPEARLGRLAADLEAGPVPFCSTSGSSLLMK